MFHDIPKTPFRILMNLSYQDAEYCYKVRAGNFYNVVSIRCNLKGYQAEYKQEINDLAQMKQRIIALAYHFKMLL